MNKRSKSGISVTKPIKHSVVVSCGKCEECLKQYQNDWMTRIYSELRRKNVAVFFTLTYNDDVVPSRVDPSTGEVHLTVCKDHVSSWLKVIREDRRKSGLSTDFKWFITSEYGPLTLRPHYHGIIAGLTLSDLAPYFAKWSRKYGFVTRRQFSMLNTKTALCTIRYTAKYCAKGDFENPLVAQGLVDPTFHLISKSIGNNYVDDNKRSYFLALDFPNKFDSCGRYSRSYLEEISKRLKYVIPPVSYHLARYYREDIFSKRPGLQAAYSDFICQRVLEQRSPSLVRIYSEKSPRQVIASDRMAVREDYDFFVRSETLRKQDSRRSVVNHFSKSKI